MSESGSSVVSFPPQEKVGLIGPLSLPQTIGATAGIGLFVTGVMTDQLVAWSLFALVVLAVTFTPWRGQPLRQVALGHLSWLRKRDKEWSAPLRGGGNPAPCLRGITYHLFTNVDDDAAPVCVVEARGAMFSVVFEVDSASTRLLSGAEQNARYNAWGEVLSGLCVERGTVLTAERVAWSDIHQASDPAALVRRHQQVGKDGPSRGDYEDYVSTFGAVAARHRVLVTATISRAGRFKLARQQAMSGKPVEVMRQAAVAVGRDLIAELEGQGFRCGPMLSPAELSRAVLDACDPFAARVDEPTARERFGLPSKTGPDQVTASRHMVEMDQSCHRVFAVRWPRVDVDAAWMHLPLEVDGPKVMTTVYGAIAPSVADVRREALTNRSETNNAVTQHRRGRVRTKDKRKSAALLSAERAIEAGHADLDGYSFVVVSARTVEELNRKTATLRQSLRRAGRADIREMTAHHDAALVAALPLGIWVKETVE